MCSTLDHPQEMQCRGWCCDGQKSLPAYPYKNSGCAINIFHRLACFGRRKPSNPAISATDRPTDRPRSHSTQHPAILTSILLELLPRVTLTIVSNSVGFFIKFAIFSVLTMPGYRDTTATFSSSNSAKRRESDAQDQTTNATPVKTFTTAVPCWESERRPPTAGRASLQLPCDKTRE